MRKLIKEILREDFDWIDNVPSTTEPGDLIPGNHYKITWEDDEWLGMFSGKGIKSGDTFKYLRGNDGYYYFKHPKASYSVSVPLDYDNEFPDGWGPKKYNIVVLPTDDRIDEDFDWLDNVPTYHNEDTLEKGKGYSVVWDDDEWLGIFKGKVKKGDIFTYVGPEKEGKNVFYHFTHPNTTHDIVIPLDSYLYDDELGYWTPQEFGINITPVN